MRRALGGCIFLALAALAAPVPAMAEDTEIATCLSNGITYKVGEIACIPGCHGQQRLARCDSSGAVATSTPVTASWTTIATACPSASATPIPRGSAYRVMVAVCDIAPNSAFAIVPGTLKQ